MFELTHEQAAAAFREAQLMPTAYEGLEDGGVGVELAKCVGKEKCAFGQAVIFPRPGWQIITFIRPESDVLVVDADPVKEQLRKKYAKARDCGSCPFKPKCQVQCEGECPIVKTVDDQASWGWGGPGAFETKGEFLATLANIVERARSMEIRCPFANMVANRAAGIVWGLCETGMVTREDAEKFAAK